MLAPTASACCRSLLAFSAREHARHAGLAHAARAAEQVGVRRAPHADGVLKRARDRLLTDQFVEAAAAVAPRQHGVALGRRLDGTRNQQAIARRLRRFDVLGLARHTSSLEGFDDAEDGQACAGMGDAAYGCCGQALTRFTSRPPDGPDRPPTSSIDGS